MDWTAPAASACAVCAAFAIGFTPPGRMPQAASGSDALSVAFGGAKAAISESMFRRADSYFYGGVDIECTQHAHGHGLHAGPEAGHDGHNGHDAEDHHHEGHHHGEHADGARGASDPWAWINAHIRAPEVERHLEGERAVELMPWFWAAVKADPHNEEAWTTAVYMADRVVKNRKLAASILEDAKKANPQSAAIMFAEGCHHFDEGRGDMECAESAFTQARAAVLASSSDGTAAGLSRKDAELYLSIIDYAAFFAARRGDAGKLGSLLGEARAIAPEGVVAKNIAKRISALESRTDIR